MNLKERIQNLCKDRGVAASKVEKDLGFGSGYISKLDKSTPNAANLQKLADYFGVPIGYLMTGESDMTPVFVPTNYDVARELTATLDQLSSDNTLMFNGLKLTEEGRLLLKNSIETAIENARIISERKKRTDNK